MPISTFKDGFEHNDIMLAPDANKNLDPKHLLSGTIFNRILFFIHVTFSEKYLDPPYLITFMVPIAFTNN